MRIVILGLVLSTVPSFAAAAGLLELPSGRASGIGVVSGWKCPPVGNLTVEFDGGGPIPLAKGISRQDTSGVCGNSGLNGFIAQYNFNLLGTGRHTAIVRDDGVEFDRSEFDVQTFGTSFLIGAIGGGPIASFPSVGSSTLLNWDQGSQNFVIAGIETPGMNVIFSDTFEGGFGLWFTDNGLWEVGAPTSGPGACKFGTSCAATVLAGDYPPISDSRFISPSIELPSIVGGEEIQLRFWEWHSISCADGGSVEVQQFDTGTQQWGAWVPIPGSGVGGDTGAWSVKGVDLTGFSDSRVRIGLRFTSSAVGGCSRPHQSTGWYVDDVEVIRIP